LSGASTTERQMRHSLPWQRIVIGRQPDPGYLFRAGGLAVTA
jgi:hypothetical protein